MLPKKNLLDRLKKALLTSVMAKTFQNLRYWLADALEFTLGNPNEAKHLPPPIGPQPYSEKPEKALNKNKN